MKTNMKEKLAKKITDIALHTVKNSVGKSFPYGVHEIKIPDSVKANYLQNGN